MVTDTSTLDWQAARLIPAVGIRGQEEQEKRATSSLLAVMRAVPDFGHALLKPLGAPKGRIEAFTEIQLKDAQGKTHIPDGAIVVERGTRTWRCLVEVKTGAAKLKADQVNRYLDMAREYGFDAVLTVSNDITSSRTDSPVEVDRRKLRSVDLLHMSWWRILTTAIVQHRHRGVSDPDQAWILGELIAYLDDDRSGASGFQDMGDTWVSVRDGATNGTLRASDREVQEVARRWEQFVEYLCLSLGQDLGRDVRAVYPRKQTAAARLDASCRSLAEALTLEAAIRVPDAAGDLTIQADFRARKIVTSIVLDAPSEGRPATRVKWLLRQLKDVPDSLVIETRFVNSKASTGAVLGDVRTQLQLLLLDHDPKREPRTFRLKLVGPMGTKRGKGERSFVLQTKKQVADFYRLVQELKPWRPAAPKLPEDALDTAEPVAALPSHAEVIGEFKPSQPRPAASVDLPD